MSPILPNLLTQDAAEAFLRQMIEISSPSGQEGQIGRYLVDQMTALGFRSHVDNAGNAVGILGEGSRTIVLLGHMDTVPGHIPVRLDQGRLFGRGAVDAKGPLATFIAAAAAAGPPRDTHLVIIGAVEEEADSAGARHIVEQYGPDFAIIGEPSGWNGITLGYKGSLSIQYTFQRSNTHTAGSASTAPEEAFRFWNRLGEWAEVFNRERVRLFDQVTPTLRAILSQNDGLTDRVEMGVNIRWPLDLEIDRFTSWLTEAAAPASVTITSFEVPFRTEKRNPLVAAFLAAIRAAGGQPSFKLKTGTSDMNIVGPAWGCPIVAYGPGDSSLDHTPDEHIVLQEYHLAIQVLAQVLSTL